MNDGIYFDIVTIKDGVEYPVKRVNILDVSKILTDSTMDGLRKVLGISNNDMKEYRENNARNNE